MSEMSPRDYVMSHYTMCKPSERPQCVRAWWFWWQIVRYYNIRTQRLSDCCRLESEAWANASTRLRRGK